MMLEFDTLIPCSEDETLCGRFARMPVADLFCIWDCDVSSWVAGSPLLIRFEEDDLLVEVAGDHAVLTAGAVDTGDASTLPALCATAPLQADACLCWRRCGLLDDFVGEAGPVPHLLAVLFERGVESGLFLDESQ